MHYHRTTAPHLPAPHPALHSPCTTWTHSAPLSPCTTLHHTRLHHIRPAPHAPHSPCTTPWISFCTMPSTTLALHHTAHSPAPHPPCTTMSSALHHESHQCTIQHIIYIYTALINISRQLTMQQIRLHNTAPHSHAPYLPCSTSALHHTRMHHTGTRLQLTCWADTFIEVRVQAVRLKLRPPAAVQLTLAL